MDEVVLKVLGEDGLDSSSSATGCCCCCCVRPGDGLKCGRSGAQSVGRWVEMWTSDGGGGGRGGDGLKFKLHGNRGDGLKCGQCRGDVGSVGEMWTV